MSHYSTMKRSLEIELISAEELKVDRKPVKRKTFCVVRIDQKSQVSKLDEFGGSFPIWKDKINMEIPISVRYIFIEVFYRTSCGHDKNVGFAKIPVTDFMGGLAPQGHLNFLSYRLRDVYGDKTGIVNVAIMVKSDGKDSTFAPSSTVAPADYVVCSSEVAVAGNEQMWREKTASSMVVTGGYGGGVVTGVPIWCAYQRPS